MALPCGGVVVLVLVPVAAAVKEEEEAQPVATVPRAMTMPSMRHLI